MKRFFALFLTAVLLLLTLSSCSIYYSLFGYDQSYTGPIIYAYLSDTPTTFDPIDAYFDDSAAFIMSLIYEGLYKYDANGKVVKGLAKGYEKTLWNTETGEFQIEITIKRTAWSDQTYVSADDFVYAWRRLLSPDSTTPAGVLLYDIKNAMKVANAEDDLTKYDLGANAVGTDILRIDFETVLLEDGSYREPDLDLFFEKLASPMLVPVRSDAVAKYTDWASTSAAVIANGPFYLKTFYTDNTVDVETEKVIRLERNKYYMRDTEVDPIDKYVKPYQIIFSIESNDYADTDDGKKGELIQAYDSASARALSK